MKPFSEACERNRAPILAELVRVFADARLVLEIGSGTGQHAAYFAAALPHLQWQPTDVAANLDGIRAWTEGIANVRAPLELDLDQPWPGVDADAAFTANTCHIVSWPQVERMFAGVAAIRSVDRFCVYGPFSYGGRHTAPSNERFDAWLRARDLLSGVRDLDAISDLAKRVGFRLAEDNALPANNRLLSWLRT